MKEYMPYGVDLRFQYRTYKNIGRSHRMEYKARKNIFYKIIYHVRRFHNKNEKYYKDFDTFSQWRGYIYEKINENVFIKKEDFQHYLVQKKRNKKIYCDMMGAIITPMYVFLLTLGMTVCMNTDVLDIDKMSKVLIMEYILGNYINISIVLIFALMFLVTFFVKVKTKVNFYNDLIIVLQK